MILALVCWEQGRPLQNPFHDGPGPCTSARLACSLAGCEHGASRAPSPRWLQRLDPKAPVSRP